MANGSASACNHQLEVKLLHRTCLVCLCLCVHAHVRAPVCGAGLWLGGLGGYLLATGDVTDGQPRYRAHSDYTGFTILLQVI